MKKILGALATVLVIIEGIILEPISAVIVLVGKHILHWDKRKLCDVYANYRWSVMGWWLKKHDISKEDLRSCIITAF